MLRGRYMGRQGALYWRPFAMRYRALHHEHSPSKSTLCHRVPATLMLRRAGLLLLLTLCPGALAAQARPLVLLTGSEIGTYHGLAQPHLPRRRGSFKEQHLQGQARCLLVHEGGSTGNFCPGQPSKMRWIAPCSGGVTHNPYLRFTAICLAT